MQDAIKQRHDGSITFFFIEKACYLP